MKKTGKIHFEDGRWIVTFNDEKLMSAKGELGWCKSNLRRNVKVQNLGIRQFVIQKEGKSIEFFNLDYQAPKEVPVKVEPVKLKSGDVEKIGAPVKKVEPQTPKAELKIRLLGQKGGAMEGYDRYGYFRERNGRSIFLSLKSAQDGGIGVVYEFDAKDGIQITNNYNHKWVIENLDEVI